VGQPTTGRPGPLPTINAATFRGQYQLATSATARPHTTTTRPARLADSGGAGHKFPHFPSTELTDVRSAYQQQTGTYTERSPTYDYEEVWVKKLHVCTTCFCSHFWSSFLYTFFDLLNIFCIELCSK
jgi:hypothetical protein